MKEPYVPPELRLIRFGIKEEIAAADEFEDTISLFDTGSGGTISDPGDIEIPVETEDPFA